MTTPLPKPAGYRILVKVPKAPETISGSSLIIKAAQTARLEEASSVVAEVVAMGADCYIDPKRFPNGPWCQVGDFVLLRAYAGSKFLIDGTEYKIINDDTVEGTVPGPEGYTRI
jgi:co-chaperonin GroES (HSP10)